MAWMAFRHARTRSRSLSADGNGGSILVVPLLVAGAVSRRESATGLRDRLNALSEAAIAWPRGKTVWHYYKPERVSISSAIDVLETGLK
jgi:hypothetical protein